MSGGDPYCGNCGYELRGLTDSSRCPECGRPFVEILQRRGQLLGGKRYTSATRVFGLPLIQIAYGPHGTERTGSARAIIAMGDRASGVLAIGGLCVGVFAFGGLSLGAFAFGGLAGGLFAFGGMSLAIWAMAGVAIGVLAAGGAALGWVVPSAGLGVAYYGRGGLIFGKHTMDSSNVSQEATRFFTDMSWLLGGHANAVGFYLWPAMAALITASFALLIVMTGLLLSRRKQPSDIE